MRGVALHFLDRAGHVHVQKKVGNTFQQAASNSIRVRRTFRRLLLFSAAKRSGRPSGFHESIGFRASMYTSAFTLPGICVITVVSVFASCITRLGNFLGSVGLLLTLFS